MRTLTDYEELADGTIYILHHRRNGNCTFRVKSWYTIDDDTDAFVTGMVVSGHLRGSAEPGDEETVRWSLCTFAEP
jgi:hypothetical protein